jgi:hypothetical protein
VSGGIESKALGRSLEEFGVNKSNVAISQKGETKMVEKAKGAETAGTAGKMKPCPECETLNPVSRMTCEVCGSKFYSKENVGKAMQQKLWESNKRLKNAIAAEDKKLAAKLASQIKKDVAQSGGKFSTDKDGYAVQVKTTVKKEKKEKKAKPTHLCPCCNQKTNPGSFFLPGHDGRSHGILIKIKLGKEKLEKQVKGIQKLYEVWKASGSKLNMKEAAEKAGL